MAMMNADEARCCGRLDSIGIAHLAHVRRERRAGPYLLVLFTRNYTLCLRGRHGNSHLLLYIKLQSKTERAASNNMAIVYQQGNMRPDRRRMLP